jgi:hypothetical protein
MHDLVASAQVGQAAAVWGLLLGVLPTAAVMRQLHMGNGRCDVALAVGNRMNCCGHRREGGRCHLR